MARRICRRPDLFAIVVDGMLVDDEVIRMRAADAVEKASRIRPDLLRPHIRQMLRDVAAVEQQEVRWHVAQIVPRLPVGARERTRAVALLESFLDDESRIVQVNAMQALADIALQNPRLRQRVIARLEGLVVDGSPAVKARGRRLLKRLHGAATRGRP